MGFSRLEHMRAGLEAVKSFPGPRSGTLTLDSMTRQNLFVEASSAVEAGQELNGYPLIYHGVEATRMLLAGLHGPDFPVQVRHGSPLPDTIFRVAHQSGLDAIEGGPVSYCLPYGRNPLRESINCWANCVSFWADAGAAVGRLNHIESFGGCMMGQLCPPSLLIAISLLEGLFFAGRGIFSLSLSYGQGTNPAQDIGAILALKRLADEYMPQKVFWHVVFYTWMGVFPATSAGARFLIEESAVIAACAKVHRIIVKTSVEAFQIPRVEDNIAAMEWVHAQTKSFSHFHIPAGVGDYYESVYLEAKAIVTTVLSLDSSLNRAILRAFQTGILDVPFCLHPDNRNRARASIQEDSGAIVWDDPGLVPIPASCIRFHYRRTTSSDLLRSLYYMRRKYDQVTASAEQHPSAAAQ